MNVQRDIGLQFRMITVMVLLGVVTIGFGAIIGLYFQNLIFTVLFVVAMSITQFWYGHKIALKSFGAKVITKEDNPKLDSMVTRLSQQANMEKPTIAIADTAIANAFATGRSTSTATVCVTTALMEKLTDEELEAVIAHELAHIKNKDMIVMTAAGTIAAITGMIIRWGYLFNSRGRNNGGIVIALILAILTYIISFLLMRALSRYREYAADRGAVSITGNPMALASALKTISGSQENIPKEDLRDAQGMNALMISPIKSKFSGLMSTHPSTEKRIEKLQDITKEMEQ